jgi:hypothetical protein
LTSGVRSPSPRFNVSMIDPNLITPWSTYSILDF